MMFNQQQAYGGGGAQQQAIGYGGAGMGAGINTGGGHVGAQNPMQQQSPNVGMGMQSAVGMAHGPAGAQAGLGE